MFETVSGSFLVLSRPKRLRLGKIAEYELLTKSFFLLLSLAMVVTAAINIRTSGLWTDELFTAYFADVSIPSFSEMWKRALEETIPPTYYILLYTLQQVSNEFIITTRSFSLICGVITIIVLYAGTQSHLSAVGRAYLIGFATTSFSWLYYSIEARAYSLSFLISAIILVVSIRLVVVPDNASVPKSRKWAMLLLGLSCAIVHYYALLTYAAVILYFVIYTINLRTKFEFFIVGSLVILLSVALVVFHRSHMAVSTEPTEAGLNFIGLETIRFLRYAFWSFGGIAFAGLLGYLLAKSFWHPAAPRSSFFKLAIFALFVVSVTALSSVAVSLVYLPIYSQRTLVVTLPFIWFAVALIFDQALNLSTPRQRQALLVFTAAALGMTAIVKMVTLNLPAKEEWRQSSAFVNSLSACKDEPVPVVASDRPSITADEAKWFYGFYVDKALSEKFLPVSRQQARDGNIQDSRWQDLVQNRIHNNASCPILLWSVHHLDLPHLERLRESIKLDGSGKEISIKSFPHYLLPNILQPSKRNQAFVLVVVDSADSKSRTTTSNRVTD